MAEDKKQPTDTLSKRSWVILIVVSATVGILIGLYEPNIFDHIRLFELPLLILAFLFSLPLHILLHEAGHLVGGLLSGYEFIMFRLFHIVWIKTDQGISKRRQHVQGLLGQALMVPPKAVTNPPFLLYHASGCLVNLLTGIVLLLLGHTLSNPTGRLMLYAAAAAAFLLFLMNAIPKQPNDGYNIMEQIKHPEKTIEFTTILRLYGEMVRGTSFTDLVHMMDFDQLNPAKKPNHVTFLTAQAAAYQEQLNFEQARAIYASIWEQRDALLAPHKPEVYLNYLFTLLLTDPHHEDIAVLKAEPALQAYEQSKAADTLKTRAAEALYVAGDVRKAKALLAEGQPLLDQAPTVTEENLERLLYKHLAAEITRFEHSQE